MEQSRSILIKGGQIVTVDRQMRIFSGDVLIEGDRIAALGKLDSPADLVIDASGKAVLPGFVQTHIHLCQTLFRGYADDLELIDWLRRRVWPLEAAHDEESLYTSALLGAAELLKGGTTCVLTMETVNHTDMVFQAVERIGLRAIIGKCIMDRGEMPGPLRETIEGTLDESLRLYQRWHGRAGGRLWFALAPRFVLSCSRQLLLKVGELARELRLLVHTHAAESRREVEMVREETGRGNIEYLDDCGLAGPGVCLAHCVWPSDSELSLLSASRTRVLHCPSSNLKLASGIAPVAEMLELGIPVSLGADGAACNNNLDMFTEMRLASLLQKVRRGPTALPASRALQLATIEGARALGLDSEIGSIEVGKKADLAIVDLEKLHALPSPDIISALVYSGRASDVRSVIVDGKLLVDEGRLLGLDERQLAEASRRQAGKLVERAAKYGFQ